MEQFFAVYEYRMGDEAFRFEAQGPADAEHQRAIALETLRERLGERFDEASLEGPIHIEFPNLIRRSA